MAFNLKTKKILIVEDFPGMRKTIREMLYTLDAFDIEEVSNGISAISTMQKNRFDIVLCDYNLGAGKNGLQVLEEAKTRKLLPFSATFIMITVEQTPGMVLGAMENKPDEYLTKPFTARQLLGRIERNIQRKNYLADIDKARNNNNFPQAILHCENLLKYGDRKMHSQLVKLRAELATDIGDFKHAQSLYENVLKTRTLNWAQIGLGKTYFLQGNYDHAKIILNQVIVNSPMMMEAYDWLAKTYLACKQNTDAEVILITAVDLSPQAILRQQKLASVAEKSDNIDVASKAYQAAIELGKYSIHKSSSDYAGLAKLYNDNNASSDALKIIDLLREEFINDPESELRATILESAIFHNMQNTESANQAFQRAKVLHKQENIPKELLLDMAAACYQNNESVLAEQIVKRLVKNYFDDNSFIKAIKAIHNTASKNKHVLQLINQARQEQIEINNKGVNLYNKGKISEAIEVLEQAMEEMPNNKTIILNITKILLREIKVSGHTKTKLNRIQNYINQATKLGAAQHKIGKIKLEYNKIMQQIQSSNSHDK
jgi:DNA-binding NarL/FixJ family response regulator/Tfp pilus assembly protein PilF